MNNTDETSELDVNFVIPWIKSQAETTKTLLKVANTVVVVYYAICFFAAVGVKFPETRSFWLGLPRSLGQGVEEGSAVVAVGALNALSSIFFVNRGVSLGIHIVVAVTVLLSRVSLSHIIFLCLYPVVLGVRGRLEANMKIYKVAIDKLEIISKCS